MINLSSGFVVGTEEPTNVGRLRDLLSFPDDYASLTDAGRAESVRRHFRRARQAYKTPSEWSDVEALNWGVIPRPQFVLGTFGPLDRALAARIKEAGGTVYEVAFLNDSVIFEPR